MSGLQVLVMPHLSTGGPRVLRHRLQRHQGRQALGKSSTLPPASNGAAASLEVTKITSSKSQALQGIKKKDVVLIVRKLRGF